MFERYAIFYTPPPGRLADFGASWLGWNSATGEKVDHPDVTKLNISDLTSTPRQYGFHGTLKAPFRMASDGSLAELKEATALFASQHAKALLNGLEPSTEHGFVALRPTGEVNELRILAGSIVQELDHFRAPLTEPELKRRRQAKLSDRQNQNLMDWGYPYIFEDFNFHLTLTGPTDKQTGAIVMRVVKPLLAAITLAPFAVDAITLMGQDAYGMFHQIHRYALTG